MPICVYSWAAAQRAYNGATNTQFSLDFDNALSTTPQPEIRQRRWSALAEQRIGWQQTRRGKSVQR